MLPRELVAALTEVRRQVPRDTWHKLTERLARSSTSSDTSFRKATADLHNRDAAWILSEAFRKNCQAKWCEIAAAMSAVDYLVGDSAGLTEIIWTGPANGRFPVRRIDQVLYDLVSTANR